MLRLVSRGLSSKEIAARLVISPKTARNHIEHIYVKIGVSNRAGASLFAVQHGLLPDEGTLVFVVSKMGQSPHERLPTSARYRGHTDTRAHETRADMSIRSKFFAATYDRQMQETENEPG